MKRENLTAYDPSLALADSEAIGVFLADAFETEDSDFIVSAIAVAVKAKGVDEIYCATGLPMEEIDVFTRGEGPISLKTTISVLTALGVKLVVRLDS